MSRKILIVSTLIIGITADVSILPYNATHPANRTNIFNNTGVQVQNKTGDGELLTKGHLEGRIIGGSAARLGEFPYQVSIHSRNGQLICGGTVINPTFVLTAAHCFGMNKHKVKPKDIYVNIGIISLRKENQYSKYKVKKIILHKKYDRYTQRHDIAVLKLDKHVETVPSHDVIIQQIGWSSNSPRENTPCVVSGYGTTASGTNLYPDSLLYVNVSIVNHESCRQNYSRIAKVETEMMCAKRNAKPGDACQGDSGGPLVCYGEVTGVVSWGTDCGLQQYPGVYTDISYYSKWIQTQVNSANSISFSSLAFFSILLSVFGQLSVM